MDISEQTKAKMLAALEHLKTELKSIRTGRANPGMVEGVSVEIYGSPMRLKDIASISSPEARMLLITPFDPKNSAVIGKAIEKANLGVSPIVEANLVRIKIPPMDDAMRKEMVKLCHKRLEEAKVSIRNIRRDGNNDARKHKDLAEDIVKKIEKTIQDLTDKCCKEADDLAQKKEKEISTI